MSASAAPDEQAGQQHKTYRPNNGRHRIGLYRATGTDRLLGSRLGYDGAFVPGVVGSLVQHGFRNIASLLGEPGDMILGEIAGLQGARGYRPAYAAGLAIVDTF
ncbi:MAG: hypothetical protein EOP22_05730 [Hyphomicrobiales bacterium]|nr:MAG: hypothetical protein EOP22_05730 [Hyphomicrobiales bacterium]